MIRNEVSFFIHIVEVSDKNIVYLTIHELFIKQTKTSSIKLHYFVMTQLIDLFFEESIPLNIRLNYLTFNIRLG